jgi:uncharacterized delta-60 repeat protein
MHNINHKYLLLFLKFTIVLFILNFLQLESLASSYADIKKVYPRSMLAGTPLQVDGVAYSESAEITDVSYQIDSTSGIWTPCSISGTQLPPNTIDTNFMSGKGQGFDNQVAIVKMQNDKVIAGGSFITYQGYPASRIARINSDGSFDTTFNVGTGANGNIQDITFQSDGKIIVVGDFTEFDTIPVGNIARLNTDGSIDTTFNTGNSGATGFGSYIVRALIQPDDKIIISGPFDYFNGVSRNWLARLNANGTLDTTFTVGTGPNGYIWGLGLQSDGKIIIGGDFTSYNGSARSRIARLNTNGSIDILFNPTGPNAEIWDLLVLPDNKVYIIGNFTTYNFTPRSKVARLNASGSLDTTFVPPVDNTVFFWKFSLQNDGKIIIAGYFTNYAGSGQNFLTRLNTNGSRDISFLISNSLNDMPGSTTIQSDNKIIIGGDFTSHSNIDRFRLSRLNPDGTVDKDYHVNSGANNSIYAIGQQSDDKIIVGGLFSKYSGHSTGYIARLHNNGNLDTTFNLNNLGANSTILSLAIQPDDKIVIAGWFTTYNGVGRNRIARLNPDGTLDTSFNPGSGANDIIYSIDIDSDGKIVIGGQFTEYDSNVANRIARLNPNGSLDNTFNTGNGANGNVWSVKVLYNNNVLIGGEFTEYNNQTRNRIARLSSNGVLDNTFDPLVGANWTVFTIDTLNDESKYVIGGGFNMYQGSNRSYIATINSDGSIDSTFAPTPGTNNTVYSVDYPSDGRPIFGGDFTEYNSTTASSITRAQENGSIVAGFNTNINANDSIRSLHRQLDGKLLVGGSFTQFNSQNNRYIMRINTAYSVAYSCNIDTTLLALGNHTVYIRSEDQLFNTNSPNYASRDFEIVSSTNISILDQTQTLINSPSIDFDPKPFSFSCLNSDAIFGTVDQYLRIQTGNSSESWSVSMSFDPASSWTNGSGGFYDFNDPANLGCTDSVIDADSYAGQLSIKFDNASIIPSLGCTNTNINLGSNSSFAQGIVNNIPLVSTIGNVDAPCHWDIFGIELQQSIPSETPAGSYTIPMTITLLVT